LHIVIINFENFSRHNKIFFIKLLSELQGLKVSLALAFKIYYVKITQSDLISCVRARVLKYRDQTPKTRHCFSDFKFSLNHVFNR